MAKMEKRGPNLPFTESSKKEKKRQKHVKAIFKALDTR